MLKPKCAQSMFWFFIFIQTFRSCSSQPTFWNIILNPGTSPSTPVLPSTPQTPITSNPTANPTGNPTKKPTKNPTTNPTAGPTPFPTRNPSHRPTKSFEPSASFEPSIEPTYENPEINYLSRPFVRWQLQLPGGFERMSGPKLRKGNAVVVSATGDQIFVTSDDGKLFVKNTGFDWDTGKVYTPPTVRKRNKDWYTVSYSGVSLFCGEDEENSPESVHFAVYAVIDVAPKYVTDPMETQSRIIAVDRNGEELWVTTIQGTVSGTPIISKYGRYIYINHNNFNSESQATVGHFSVLDGQINGRLHFTESVEIYPHARKEWGEKWEWRKMDQYFGGSPYGPLSRTNHKKNFDLLYWGESARNGYGNEGAVHRVQVNCRTGRINTEILDMTIGYSVNLAPVIAEDGDQIFLTSANSTIIGWNDLMRSNPFTINKQNKTWKADLGTSARNASSPLTNRPVLERNHRRMYVASAGTSFNCINAHSGEIIWTNPPENSTSVYLGEAKVSPSNQRVYSIQHLDGRVVAQDARNGDIIWEWSCFDVTRDRFCQDSVEAEFALSPDGRTIYYGDIYGKIVALAVAKPTGSTRAPTALPTVSPSAFSSVVPTAQSDVPTMVPSIHPTDRPTVVPSIFPTDRPSEHPSSLPTDSPSQHPSRKPSSIPSDHPTDSPSTGPSLEPSNLPTEHPSNKPSNVPSDQPSLSPSTTPTATPTAKSSATPTKSFVPSSVPSVGPTPFYGILVLKSVSPEVQIVAVSFMGLAGAMALVSVLALIFVRKRPKATGRSEVNTRGIGIQSKPDGGESVLDEASVVPIPPSTLGVYLAPVPSEDSVHAVVMATEHEHEDDDDVDDDHDYSSILSESILDDASQVTSLTSILENKAMDNIDNESVIKDSYSLADVMDDESYCYD